METVLIVLGIWLAVACVVAPLVGRFIAVGQERPR